MAASLSTMAADGLADAVAAGELWIAWAGRQMRIPMGKDGFDRPQAPGDDAR